MSNRDLARFRELAQRMRVELDIYKINAYLNGALSLLALRFENEYQLQAFLSGVSPERAINALTRSDLENMLPGIYDEANHLRLVEAVVAGRSLDDVVADDIPHIDIRYPLPHLEAASELGLLGASDHSADARAASNTIAMIGSLTA